MRNWRDYFADVWARVDVRGTDDCWEWTGARMTSGYGRWYRRDARQHGAHRVVWELTSAEPIPAGLFVLHSCDNPPCCNPAHLRVGTYADNMRDMMARHRHPNHLKTHCIHGHRLDGVNLSIRCDNRRICRTCLRARSARYAAKRKLAA